MPASSFFSLTLLLCFSTAALAGDPFVFYDWTVSYMTASPLGVKQRVISSLQFSAILLYFGWFYVVVEVFVRVGFWQVFVHCWVVVHGTC